ncbi:hypothetical protein Q8A73_000737 [Channa argus]|nr:hypothetical protein Q8A73_000737 [Channa argus]
MWADSDCDDRRFRRTTQGPCRETGQLHGQREHPSQTAAPQCWMSLKEPRPQEEQIWTEGHKLDFNSPHGLSHQRLRMGGGGMGGAENCELWTVTLCVRMEVGLADLFWT